MKINVSTDEIKRSSTEMGSQKTLLWLLIHLNFQFDTNTKKNIQNVSYQYLQLFIVETTQRLKFTFEKYEYELKYYSSRQHTLTSKKVLPSSL